ncbi:unnamed protein product [Adineta ricciae]|uniref:Uncharacterized protein n=1 Tax=Adineta ricciae TaxID=249248 RepID=A0A815PXV0_ADIRI|nr:unnamed protein product [Adineta ricciae]CAF1674233.1 unnamed protein product [Adineta ricciae]
MSNAPVWTVPKDPTTTSHDLVLLSTENVQLQTFNTSANSPAADDDDRPPNYFDISNVPSGAILYHNDVLPFIEPSKAATERLWKGVMSLDQLIDKNPDQLWLYFMTYLEEKPELVINIRGSYTEYYTETGTSGNSQGNTVTNPRTMDEFTCAIDLQPYICDRWWRVAAMPSLKASRAGDVITLRDVLEQYTFSNKKFKEITLRKQIHGWNLEHLKANITELVRSTGYRYDIHVTYIKRNYKIVARSSSPLNRFANSLLVRVLCVISCLCLIFRPIYCCLRAMGSTRDNIIADYKMMKPADTFLRLNSNLITDTVIRRANSSYTARIQ